MFAVRLVDAGAGRLRLGQRATKPSRVLGRDYVVRLRLYDGSHGRLSVVASALLPVPGLDARKLSVSYMSTGASDVKFLREGQPRRYTLTHNDLTAQLHLAIGDDFNTSQISGWYSRLVRDEVCAEWCFSGGPALHLHCHVSGAVSWFAPARFRSHIFAREMPLVLDSIVFAERHLFTCRVLRQAPVFVHFEAVESDLARVEYWGTLGQWIERTDGPVEAHLSRVSRTVLNARPATPRSARLDGPLESLLELVTDSLVERPRPGGGVEAARSVLQGCSAADRDADCAVCGEGHGDPAAAAAAARRAEAAECDCAACSAAAEAAAAVAPAARPAAHRAGAMLWTRSDAGARLSEGQSPANRGDVANGVAASSKRTAGTWVPGQLPQHGARTAAPASLREPAHAWHRAASEPGGDALGPVDMPEDDGAPSMRRAQVPAGRARTILSLERAVGASPGPVQRRRTLSHYVAPAAPASAVYAGAELLPLVPGRCLPMQGVVAAAASAPSLQAELARRSRAAEAELRRKGSRSRTPEGGRRRVSV